MSDSERLFLLRKLYEAQSALAKVSAVVRSIEGRINYLQGLNAGQPTQSLVVKARVDEISKLKDFRSMLKNLN